jgi:hypothetical protein
MIKINESEFIEYAKDSEYLHSHYSDYLKKYDQQYIAIKNKEVVAHSENIDELKNQLNSKNMELGSALIEYIRDKRDFVYY